MSDIPVRVRKQLDLDVTRPLDVALAEDAVVPERSPRLAPRGLERFVQLDRFPYDTHPAPAATRSRLDDEREADLPGLAGRDHRHARLAGDPLCFQLVAAGAQGVGRRPDPGQLR